jgi:hypothetical protein
MKVDNIAGKGTSGVDMVGSVIDRMNMNLGGSKFLKPFRIKTQLFKRPHWPACDCCRWCHPLPKGWCGG